MQSEKRQGHSRDNHRRDTLEQPIGTIPVGRKAEFTAQLAQPQDRPGQPLIGHYKHDLSRQEYQSEQAALAFHTQFLGFTWEANFEPTQLDNIEMLPAGMRKDNLKGGLIRDGINQIL